MNKEEFIAKLKEAKSADEILALAKESGVELSEEKAKELFAGLNANGEMSDEELDEVAGGSGFMDMLSRGLDDYRKQHPHV